MRTLTKITIAGFLLALPILIVGLAILSTIERDLEREMGTTSSQTQNTLTGLPVQPQATSLDSNDTYKYVSNTDASQIQTGSAEFINVSYSKGVQL